MRHATSQEYVTYTSPMRGKLPKIETKGKFTLKGGSQNQDNSGNTEAITQHRIFYNPFLKQILASSINLSFLTKSLGTSLKIFIFPLDNSVIPHDKMICSPHPQQPSHVQNIFPSQITHQQKEPK